MADEINNKETTADELPTIEELIKENEDLEKLVEDNYQVIEVYGMTILSLAEKIKKLTGCKETPFKIATDEVEKIEKKYLEALEKEDDSPDEEPPGEE